jgi:hypothetical protein
MHSLTAFEIGALIGVNDQLQEMTWALFAVSSKILMRNSSVAFSGIYGHE